MKNLFMIMTFLLVGLMAVGAFAQAGPQGKLDGDPVEDPNIENRNDTDGTQTQYGPPEGGDGPIIPLIPLDEDIVFVDMDGDGFCDYQSQQKPGDRAGQTMEMLTGDSGERKGKAWTSDAADGEKVFGDENPGTGTSTGDSWNEHITHGHGFDAEEPIDHFANEGEDTPGEANDRGSRGAGAAGGSQ